MTLNWEATLQTGAPNFLIATVISAAFVVSEDWPVVNISATVNEADGPDDNSGFEGPDDIIPNSPSVSQGLPMVTPSFPQKFSLPASSLNEAGTVCRVRLTWDVKATLQ